MRIKYDATSARFCVLLNSCRNVNGAEGGEQVSQEYPSN